MKSTTTIKFSALFILLVSSLIQNFSLAQVDPVTPDPATAQLIGNTIQIVPTTTQAALADCDSRGQDRAYYAGSAVGMKVQALPSSANKRIVATSRILKYDPYDVFQNLSFPTISNIVPTTTITANKPVIVVDVDDNSLFKKPTSTYTRGQLAAQLMSNMHYQGISTTSTSNPVNYSYLLLNATSPASLSLNSNNLIQVIQQTYVCFNYYLASCGDGVRDNYVAGGNGDGINGIMVNGSIVPWHGFTTAPTPPAEECDDGNNIDTDSCTNQCKNSSPQTPTCNSLTINPTTGTTSTVYNFNCAGTNATSYQINITNNGTPVAGMPLQYTGAGPFVVTGFGPLPAGSNIVTCTVFGANTSNSCHNQTVQVGTINQNTTLQITKTLVPNPLVPDGKYRPGDTVTFRIDFANTGPNPAINARVWDVFPNSLIHITTGDQLIGIQPPYNYGIYSNGTNEVIEYSGFYLPAGAAGYMIVKGIAQGYEWANQTYNHAYIISDNATIKDAHLYFDYAIPNANVTINKTLTTAGPFYPGSIFGFTLTLQNNGDTVNNIQIQDLWPSTPCIIPSNNYISNMSLQSNGSYSRTLNGAFNQGQVITINMTGQILNDPVCAAVGSYINKGTYAYTLVGVTHTGSASAVIPVAPTPYANIDFQKTILQAGSQKGDTISYKITYKNNGTNPLSSFVVTDFWPGTLNYVSASPLPFNPPLGNSCAQGCSLNRYINATLQPGAVGEIVLTGTIK